MEVALTASRSLLSSLRCSVTVSRGFGFPGQCGYSIFSCLHYQKLTVKCSVKVPTAESFGEPNKLTTYLHILSETLWKPLPEPVKEFPWKKAKDLALRHLFHVGKKALKWFLVSFLLVSFASDVFYSFSRNRELTIPLGFFIGITAADFLVEISKEISLSGERDNSVGKLLVVGTLFACIKLLTPCLALSSRMVLSHISNGGLMQILWLAKELQGTEGGKDAQSTMSSEQVES